MARQRCPYPSLLLWVALASGGCYFDYDPRGPALEDYPHKRDPTELHRYVLRQTDVGEIFDGMTLLLDNVVNHREKSPSKSAKALEAYIDVYKRLESGWPSLRATFGGREYRHAEDRVPLLKSKLLSLMSVSRDRPDIPEFRHALTSLRPDPSDDRLYKVWEEVMVRLESP